MILSTLNPRILLLQVTAADTSGLTDSFLQHQVELIVADVKELVSRVSDVHFVEADNLTVPAISYEVGLGLGPGFGCQVFGDV